MRLGLFELTVFLTDDAFEFEVFAGQDRDQVDSAQDRFRIVQTTRNDIVREILLKLERALAGNATSIEVNVQRDTEIIRDPTFPLPASTVLLRQWPSRRVLEASSLPRERPRSRPPRQVLRGRTGPRRVIPERPRSRLRSNRKPKPSMQEKRRRRPPRTSPG